MAVRDRTAAIVDGRPFQRVIIGVIAVNAIALGCETSPALVEAHGGVLTALDRAALAVFTAELAARLYAHRLRFFRDPWNCFDLVVVGLALLPAAGPLSIVRSLRVLRALRLVAMVPSMRRVVTALVRSIPGLLSLSGLLLLLLYVGGVVAINLFRGSGDARFEDLGATVLTLFQITTGDSWSDVMRDVMDEQPLAWVSSSATCWWAPSPCSTCSSRWCAARWSPRCTTGRPPRTPRCSASCGRCARRCGRWPPSGHRRSARPSGSTRSAQPSAGRRTEARCALGATPRSRLNAVLSANASA